QGFRLAAIPSARPLASASHQPLCCRTHDASVVWEGQIMHVRRLVTSEGRMRKSRSLKAISASVLAVPVLAAIVPVTSAATLYWDTDGSITGDNTTTGAGLGGSG